jgi:hypothetical protein
MGILDLAAPGVGNVFKKFFTKFATETQRTQKKISFLTGLERRKLKKLSARRACRV